MRIPVICADPATVVGARIFNPNLWAGNSRGIVQSCWSEYSVLHHCVAQIDAMCGEAEGLCRTHIETLQQQWVKERFDLGKVVILGQSPDLHMRIETFFSSAKTLLDLLVQMLLSEKIVSGFIDGFHRDKNVYGGRVLNVLQNNATDNRKDLARHLAEFIVRHKSSWIDQAIVARDCLIHPQRGMHQLMFHLVFVEQKDRLACVEINPPQIGSVPINQYAKQVLEHVTDFSSGFLSLVREATPSGGRMEPTY